MSEELSIETLRIRQWIENNIGGRFVRFEKLSRWRPSWEADVELDGSIIRLHVRGDRGGSLSNRPLRREYDVLRLLEQNGIPVPRLYGWCDDPEAIIMANLPDTPFMGDVDGDPTVQGLVESYAEHLAAIHRLDAQAFIDIGISAPGQGKELALNYLHFAEERYLADKDGPDALITFACQWLRRNAPGHRNMITPLVGDAPQFFHNGKEITALYDLELANLGDPLSDLASIRVRDTNEPISNVAAVLARYEVESGEAIDWPVLSFYTALLFIAVPMISQSSLRLTSPHPAFIEYLSWSLGCSRAAIEAMAEKDGLTLDPVPVVTAGDGRSSAFPFADAAFRELLVQCSDIPAEGFLRQSPALSLAQYLARINELGAAIDQADLDDARTYLGVSVEDSKKLEAALDDFVRAAPAARDADIMRFFHRRSIRRLQLLCDYPGPIVKRGLPRVGPDASV